MTWAVEYRGFLQLVRRELPTQERAMQWARQVGKEREARIYEVRPEGQEG